VVGLQGKDRRGSQDTAGRNEREYRLPELPHFSVDVFCQEARTVYEFLGCYYQGNTCQPYRDVTTIRKDSLAESYERTMMRIEQITRSGYQVEIQWVVRI